MIRFLLSSMLFLAAALACPAAETTLVYQVKISGFEFSNRFGSTQLLTKKDAYVLVDSTWRSPIVLLFWKEAGGSYYQNVPGADLGIVFGDVTPIGNVPSRLLEGFASQSGASAGTLAESGPLADIKVKTADGESIVSSAPKSAQGRMAWKTEKAIGSGAAVFKLDLTLTQKINDPSLDWSVYGNPVGYIVKTKLAKYTEYK